MQKSRTATAPQPKAEQIIVSCLEVFVRAGSFSLSLDRLAEEVGVSKRMLIHYFGSREFLEERAIELLETRLRAQFSPDQFPSGISLQQVVSQLWKRTAAATSKGLLLLIMDISKRAWDGSRRARKFYSEQQRLWVQLLMRYMPEKDIVEDVLQSFQGAALVYLVTGDARPGERMLNRICKQVHPQKSRSLANGPTHANSRHRKR